MPEDDGEDDNDYKSKEMGQSLYLLTDKFEWCDTRWRLQLVLYQLERSGKQAISIWLYIDAQTINNFF